MMIASLLGVLLLYAVYQAFELSERTKRNAMTIADMQISGLQAAFLMEQEIGNAGNGLLPAAASLARCQDEPLFGSAAFLSLRPLPAVIKKGKDDDANDEVFVFYGTAPRHTVPLAITDATLSPPGLTVQTPLGFSENNVLTVVPATGNCYAYNAPDASSLSIDFVDGTTHFFLASFHEDIHKDDLLIDLGSAIRRNYYVKDDVLYMQEWRLEDHRWKLKITGDPLISHVVRFWAQYGIDTAKNDYIDQWVPATGIWSTDSLRKAPLDQIRQIKALRLAFVLRSEEPDKEITNDYIASVFLDCPLHATCSGKTAHIAHDTSQPYGWRYRTYEVVVPMRNAIWNFRD